MKYKNSEILYRGKRVNLLSVEEEYPRGIVKREVVDHPGAVVILPFLDSETVILIRNERYVVQQTLWELPAGTLEPGEDPMMCAARELIEETGYQAGQIAPLLSFFTTPGFCNEQLHAFIAKDLTYIGQNLDETEKIVPFPTPFTETLKMIQEGVICDAKTICSLLYFHSYKKTR